MHAVGLVASKGGNARGAKRAGHRHLGRVNRQREEPDTQRKAAAFARWHEPDDARVSRPDPRGARGDCDMKMRKRIMLYER